MHKDDGGSPFDWVKHVRNSKYGKKHSRKVRVVTKRLIAAGKLDAISGRNGLINK